VDYSKQSVAAVIRGPLVHTPQGLVVILAGVVYFGLALVFGATGITPPADQSTGSAVFFCLFWPFVLFLLFVKHGVPSFNPSWGNAAFLALCALMPVGFVIWGT
jgi:hypothetical protein